MKRGLFPGSFDPYTKGHEIIVEKALELFDEVVIGVGINASKVYLFDTEKRLTHIQALYKDNPRVRMEVYNKLTVDFCKDIDAQFIIRGIRDTKDYEYERAIAQMNKDISGIETVVFFTDAKYASISSTIIRELHKNGANIEQFVTNSHLIV